MKFPTLINIRGYQRPDPLDSAPPTARFIIVCSVNTILSIVLIYAITTYRVVSFNGFSLFNFHFPPMATMIIEVLINGLIYSPLIVLLRKASSIVHYLIVFLPYYLLDLFIQDHYRCSSCPNSKALWTYYPDSIVSGIKVPAFKFLITISVDAIIFGILALFISRLVALLIFKKTVNDPTRQEYQSMFNKKWTEEAIPRPKRDLSFWILRLLGFGYTAYLSILVVGLLGSSPWPTPVKVLMDMTYANPALAITTYFKIILMVMLAFIGAYNKTLRYHGCFALIVGHLLSTVFSLVFHYYKPLNATETDFLLVSAIVDGVMIVIFLFIMLKHRREARIFAAEKDMPVFFSVPTTLMQRLFTALFILLLAITVSILLFRILGEGKTGISAVFGFPDPMIGNTLTLYGTLSFIFFLLIKRERLRQHFFNIVLFPFITASIISLLWVLIGDMSSEVSIHTRFGSSTTADWYFVLFAAVHLVICLLMVKVRKMFYRVDYSVNTLSPSAAVSCMALSRALFMADEKQQDYTVHAIDQYSGGITGRKRGLLNLPFSLFENVLSFVYGLHPAFSSMSREEQRYYLSKYFFANELKRKRAFIPYLAEFAYQIGLSINAMIVFANYCYINVRYKIGYVPVDARDRTQGDIPAFKPPFRDIEPLPKDHSDPRNFKPVTEVANLVAPRVTTPYKENDVPDEVDFLIIGSGAGGATMAYRLSCELSQPEKILVVERGSRYSPLQDFQDNEIEMMKKVYKEGGLQQTKKYTMTVLQGECLGGTTVVNNAVCFKMPDHVKRSWEKDFGMKLDSLETEYEQIAEELSIKPLGAEGVNTIVKSKFLKAVAEYNASVVPAERLVGSEDPVLVNSLNNTGDGNWNLGNKRMRKRSMLETYIPWAESRGVNFASNMTAVRFVASPTDPRKADHVILRTDSGILKKVRVKKAVICCGGVIASSHFLMRSEVKNVNIGKRVSCNFAFPVAFGFDEQVRAYDGEQITMAALDPQNRCAFETYFNPPAAFALASVPFFFRKRDEMMKQYSSMLNLGALVGSEPNGEVERKPSTLNGLAFNWQLGKEDIEKIKYGLTTLIQLGKYAGSTKAYLPTKPGIELDLRNNAELQEFFNAFEQFPLRMTDVFLGTAHPQGGNLCSGESEYKNRRVVNEDFQVEGFDNVYVADASVFPTSITINPQWTIMALSSMAAKAILSKSEVTDGGIKAVLTP